MNAFQGLIETGYRQTFVSAKIMVVRRMRGADEDNCDYDDDDIDDGNDDDLDVDGCEGYDETDDC